MAEMFAVPLVLMPEVRDTAGDYGQTAATVLGAPLPIRAVVGDQQGALMGQGCIAAGQMKATYGTGCFMLLHTGEQAHRSAARLLTTVAAQLNGRATYALEGSQFIAGAAIQWVEQAFGVQGGPRAVEALAARARPDHGVVLVPAFTGLGAPWWDADARGALLGLTRDSGLADISAAAFDGCALQTRDLIEAMAKDAPEAFGAQAVLKIDGGMASSALFRRRLADLTGITVRTSQTVEATALGAALFAGMGAGLFGSAQAAIAGLAAGDGETAAPTMDARGRESAYARWTDAVARVRNRPPS
jgi:glycerol kinase